jgi:hypothetical protein
MAVYQQAKGVLVAGQHLRHHGCIADLHLLTLDRWIKERLGKKKAR